MAKKLCWFDGSRPCYATGELTLEACKICQDVRLKRATLRKGMNPFGGGAK